MTFRQRTYGFFVLFCFNRVATYKVNPSYCAVWVRSALPGPFVSFLFLRVPPGFFFSSGGCFNYCGLALFCGKGGCVFIFSLILQV